MQPKKSGRYRLERQLPTGAVKSWPEPMGLRAAAQSVAYCLVDNSVADRKAATAVGMAVERADVGTWTDGPGGYRFRLVP